MPKSIPRTHKIQILEVLGLNFRGPNGQCAMMQVNLYYKYQGPKIVAPFYLLRVLKNLDDFKI